ncbi:MAG: MarR family transcriptional regulator [Parachlamydiales bacterium]|nr:MarR family transcriptional regulator [Parachlamydiales bacterium]
MNFEEVSIYEGPKQSPGFLLWHISTSWRSSIEDVLKEFGLTHPQFVVLATTGWISRSGDSATQIAIGKMAGLDPNTTSQVIRGLEQKQLVKREPSGRVKNVYLTPAGSNILKKALPAVEKADSQFFSLLTGKELDSLVAIFQKFLAEKN